MFVLNDDMSIYTTRGDVVFFAVLAENDEGEAYTFQPGDVVRMKVFHKKNCDEVVLQKDFPVFKESEQVEIILTKEDTKLGKVVSKPTDFWYEIELNPDTDKPQTLVGYSEDGPAVFRVMPEGADLVEYIPTEEDIPFVDTELDLTSPRPVANRAISARIVNLERSVEALGGGGGSKEELLWSGYNSPDGTGEITVNATDMGDGASLDSYDYFKIQFIVEFDYENDIVLPCLELRPYQRGRILGMASSYSSTPYRDVEIFANRIWFSDTISGNSYQLIPYRVYGVKTSSSAK